MSDPLIRSYDSVEDMIADLQTGEQQANAHLADVQRAITYGDHWVRFYDIPHKILIFGRVDTIAEVDAAERACATPDDPVEDGEIEQILAHTRASHSRGYMYGRAYSVITPEGELGSTHISHIWPISERLFAAAKAADWMIDNLAPGDKVTLSAVYLAWGSHEHHKNAERRANGSE